MKRWALCLGVLTAAGCFEKVTVTVGAFREAPPVAVSAAIAEATAPGETDVAGDDVTVAGDVAAVCQSARCWIELQDATGRLHVELAGFRAPSGIVGLPCRAQGKVIEKDGRPVLIAKGIRFEK